MMPWFMIRQIIVRRFVIDLMLKTIRLGLSSILFLVCPTMSIAVADLIIPSMKFELRSPDITHDKPMSNVHVYNGFGCTGENQSPALSWRSPPSGTKSFALMVHDPDAPTGGAGWWHWIVYDIPPTTRALPRGAGRMDQTKMVKGAVQVKTDYGQRGWGGPCPPQGAPAHRYVFTLYALGVANIDVPQAASPSQVGFLVNQNAIGKTKLVATYKRGESGK